MTARPPSAPGPPGRRPFRGAAPPLVLALDVGTSSCRAAWYDAAGNAAAGRPAQIVTPVHLTPDGGAEVDSDALVEVVATTIDRLFARHRPRRRPPAAVAVSTFWHSLVGIGADGRAVTPVYLWLDGRAREAAADLRGRLDERAVHARTGCVFHATYWPAKLVWLRRARPDIFAQVRRWASFGDYFLDRVLGEAATSISLASGTGLLDQRSLAWDGPLLEALAIDPATLPAIGTAPLTTASLREPFAARWPWLRGVPWLLPIGDGACSNLGAGCATRDRLALMIGTSGALRALWRASGDLAIPWGAWAYRAGPDRVVVGGAVNDGGSLFAWLRRTLKLPSLAATEAAVAALEPDGHGLTVLPLWGGERSPHWATDARGAIVGQRLDTTPIEILRASLEAVAIRFAGLEAILRGVVPEAREIVATGGAILRSPAWLQIVADAIDRPVVASAVPEASSRGAALLAGEALGLLPEPIESLPPPAGRVYRPVPEHVERYRAAAERQERLYQKLIAS